MFDFVESLDDLSELDNCHVSLLAYLQINNLLPSKCFCTNCNKLCCINFERKSFFFRCKCGFKCSLNKGTWFYKARLSYTLVLKVLFCFVHSIRIKAASSLLSLSEKTLVDWYSNCREICIESNLRKGPIILGGINKVVEIDMTIFGQRKYYYGKKVEGHWVLGVMEQNSHNSFFLPVEKYNIYILYKIINQYIKPGTTIIIGCWKACNFNQSESFKYLKINYSIIFKDLCTGGYINTFDSHWWAIKRNLPAVGPSKIHFEGYLATYIWQKTHENPNLFESFLEDIAQIYKFKVSIAKYKNFKSFITIIIFYNKLQGYI